MSIRSIDRTDRRILRALQQDGRMTNANLAKSVALSPSPCLRRVNRLEDEGVIRGYRAELDPRALGWGITAFVHVVSTKPPEADVIGFEKDLAKIPQIVSCHAVTGPTDLILRVVARDLDDYYRLMHRIGTLAPVKDAQSSIAMAELKADAGLPVE